MSRDLNFAVRKSLADSDGKKRLNSELFSGLAQDYDAFTPLMSLWRDHFWKKKMVAMLPDMPSPVCVDIACGTGDVIHFLAVKYNQSNIVGVDLVMPMLVIAQARLAADGVSFVQQDMCRLGIQDGSVDILTAGYAIRNAPDLEQCLAEICRILKPRGVAAFLEFSKPRYWPFDIISCWVMATWGRVIGWLFHWRPEVCVYVGESLKAFPDRNKVKEMMRQRGLEPLRSKLLMFGLAEILIVRKET
ncbi:MAG: hypothetical protein A2283_20225 [Lentisphaerae bacterium RIFOXYA12_FULL_48_11]|nr:MAG: hypothetical protein A2283_20225 [Lentisphaerae bacterium RIFOXYA12_FULL_48_11]